MQDRVTKAIVARLMTLREKMGLWLFMALFALLWSAVVTFAADSHVGKFSVYEGTKTCLKCHSSQAKDMWGSVHYQWKASTIDLVAPAATKEGKLGSINDFCIYPDINWLGKLKNVDGQLVDGGCARCHAGLGDKPSNVMTQAQLENIDCLVCHAPNYKRTLTLVNGVYKFVPDTANMTVSPLEAAQKVQKTTRDTCLNCHTKAGGGNNFKRGDIEEAHRNPPSRSFDVHMSSTALDGGNMHCTSCHKVTRHRIAGRGVDLKGRDDTTFKVSCTNCHSGTHGNSDIDKHTKRVYCTTCHIPTFAKAAQTDMDRDWSAPGELNPVTGLYEPFSVKAGNVVPEYRFWNGKSQFYNFGTPSELGPNNSVEMAKPIGNITMAGSKIYAFKHHSAMQPVDSQNRLLPLKIGIFFSTNNILEAIKQGAAAVGWTYNDASPKFQSTERWMGLFHEVAPKSSALTCKACHNSTASRIPFKQLGYQAKTSTTYLCSSCHTYKNYSTVGFFDTHNKHVKDKGIDCSKCHGFSKAL